MKKTVLAVLALMVINIFYSRNFKESEIVIVSTSSMLEITKLSICGNSYLAEGLKIGINDPVAFPIVCGEGAFSMIVYSKQVTEPLEVELYVTAGINNILTIAQDNNSLTYSLEADFNIF